MNEAQWYFMDRHGQRAGPVDAATLAAALDSDRIGRDSLVWRDGMAQWQPLASVADELGLVLPDATPPTPSTSPPPPPAAAAGPVAPATTGPDPAASTPEVVYAGFWRRYAALFLDQLILGTAFYLLLVVLGVIMAIVSAGADVANFDENGPPVWFYWTYLVVMLLYYAAAGAYFSLQESSVHQATLGKRALGIKVVDLQGRRLSRGAALGRWFAAALSYLTLYIGFLMAAFTTRKQALHDIIAGTLVVDQWAYTATPDRQQRGLSGCLIAAIVGLMLMIGIAILGILAAIAIPAYQDYTVRARVSEAIVTATPLKPAVSAYYAQNGTCPVNGEGGIESPQSYAGSYLSAIDVGTMTESGWCGIQVTLRNLPAVGEDGKLLWLEYDPAADTWYCSSEIDDRYLSVECRGWPPEPKPGPEPTPRPEPEVQPVSGTIA